MSNPIIGMGELSSASAELGNKISNLAILARSGVRVPRGFGLSFSAYSNHVSTIMPELEMIRKDVSSYDIMEERMRDVIVSKNFPYFEEVMDAIDEYSPGANYFAVRSSGAPVISGVESREDSSNLSLAGQYESFLLVPRDRVVEAILWCYASLFSERCLSLFKVREDGSYLWSKMSVLIQEMHAADVSAVVMTRDPVEGGDSFGVELTYGACEALVSGEVNGDLHLLSRVSGKILSSECGSKATTISHVPLLKLGEDNKIRSKTASSDAQKFASSQKVIGEIYNLSMHIERIFGCPQDIELIISNGEIIITQTRPITASN